MLHEGMNSKNTALFVIDPVNSCAHKKCETPEWGIHFTKIRKMLPKLNSFVKEYREKFGSLVLQKTVLKHQTIIKNAKKNGAKLEKEDKCDQAKLKYEEGLAAAHDLFKLGFAEIDEDIRFFNKKSMECGKRSGEITEYRVVITKENLLNSKLIYFLIYLII